LNIISKLGTLPAFWLWKLSDPWPSQGEIDIYEIEGKQPNTLHGTLHTSCCNGGNGKGGTTNVNDPSGTFHVYAADWNEKRIIWYVDGREYFRVNNNGDKAVYPFFTAKPIILNLAVGGSWPGNPNPADFPQEFVIDYVKVYAPNP
jgi:beta-glucanase (GH16 family)